MRFFTSDLHFGHEAVIGFCNRPFNDVEDMNESLIRNWNSVVGKEDQVYVLGDFSFMNSTKTKAVVTRLNGDITLIEGNHDQRPKRFFKLVLPNFWVTFPGKIGEVQMSHYPYKGVDCNDRRDFSHLQLDDGGDWLLHGHVHCLWKRNGRMINVGVDVWNYKPVSENELAELIYDSQLHTLNKQEGEK